MGVTIAGAGKESLKIEKGVFTSLISKRSYGKMCNRKCARIDANDDRAFSETPCLIAKSRSARAGTPLGSLLREHFWISSAMQNVGQRMGRASRIAGGYQAVTVIRGMITNQFAGLRSKLFAVKIFSFSNSKISEMDSPLV